MVGGTQQALNLAARVLIDEGNPIVLEDPHYQLALHALVAHGARLIHARTDNDGLVVSELPTRSARMVYVTPSHQFPSGATLSLERRIELLRWAGERDCWILEDDYEAEFLRGRQHPPALKSLDAGDRVIYVGTFSKTLFPALRLGYVVAPKQLREDFRSAKRLDDLASPVIEQSALAALIQSRQYDKHLRGSYRELEDRRRALLDALRRVVPDDIEFSHSCGAMHLAVWLRRLNFAQCDKLIEHAAARGLGLHPLHTYYRVRPARPGLLLGFAGLPSSQLRLAVDIFGRCLREL